MTHPLDTEFGQRYGNTLPGRLACWAEAHPQVVALREKEMGLWKEVTWATYWRNVQAVAEQFAEWGLGQGDRIAILCGNRPEWLYADLGIQLLGGMSAGVYETNPADDVVYVVNHSQSRAIVCEDQEQVDKVLERLADMPQLEHILVVEPRGTLVYSEPRLSLWKDFLDQGLARIDQLDPLTRLAELDPQQPANIVYTSGTTGRPKGALLTHHSALALVRNQAQDLGVSAGDCVLSYLPLCHVAEKIYTLFFALTEGTTVHFGESIETVREDLAEVAPTLFLGVPRIWEKMAATVQVKMLDADPIKRWLFRRCLAIGESIAEQRLSGRLSAGEKLKGWLVDRLVFAALRERLGLGRCRYAGSGAAPIAPELLSWLHAIGIPVTEGYGMTELSGLSHYNRPGAMRLGSVGQPIKGVEHRIADDGELLVRCESIIKGYLDNPEATAEAIDSEGWLHTGDIGEIDADDYLWLTGRKKEIMITAGGKNIAPAKIENALKTSPFIKEVVSIGDARPFVAALIQIDYDMVGNWAQQRNLAYTSFPDLAAKPDVIKLIDAEILRINEQALARVEQVRKFKLLPKELHQDDDELTATQKVRRKNVMARYAGMIEALYSKNQEAA